MLNLPFTFEFYFYSKPVDMRKSFTGLYLLVLDMVLGQWCLGSDKVKSRVKSDLGKEYEYVDDFNNADSLIRIKHLQ